MYDPIVAEVREIRNAHSKKFNYDVKAIFEDYDNRQNEIMDRLNKIRTDFTNVSSLESFSALHQNNN